MQKDRLKEHKADAIEEFIKEHTSLNFRGEPYIFITNTEYEQLKEQKE